ncbi:MAG: UDP-galactose-lipid carrier transferase (EC [uncultured Sulfurovum sp.]|uniref:ADP/GDP-polyphosphate phosphotransferase n=1 Tax=uncultured Sulfurovum sp. TaxID=269237 RepID=A0A6S6TRC9_9BACT|nr:MAG: UDP-galactose-lipid carrier transferase (EC [uncultured Sulfurovum sp.]
MENLEIINKQLQEENQVLKEKYAPAYKLYQESKELEPYQAELIKLQKHIERHNKKLVILVEGRDAAGKGTLIGTISTYMNPKHYRIVALGKPSKENKSQWYFQRYVNHFPSAGEIVFFDRSWYNRAMVEPILNFCTQEEHDIFMKDVTQFEQSLVHNKLVIIKLYLSVNKTMQLERFERRRSDPLRSWKLSEIDLQAQIYWDDFSKMKYKMLSQTHHEDAKWNVIRSNNKHQARIEVMKLILNQFDYEDRDQSLSFEHDMSIVIPIEEELKMMKATRKDLFS